MNSSASQYLRRARLVPALMLLLALGGCAILNRDNTPALNLVEKKLLPKDPGRRALAFPLVFPVGVLAVSADALIIHPCTVIDDAARETKDCVWSDFDLNWDNEYVTECTSLPFRTAVTPVFFAGDFLGRSMFDIPESAEEARKHLPKTVDLQSCQVLLDQGKAKEALDALDQIKIDYSRRITRDDTLRLRIETLRLKAAIGCENYDAINMSSLNYNNKGVDPAVLAELRKTVESMCVSDKPMLRWNGYQIDINSKGYDKAPDSLQRMLADPNPVIRYLVLKELRYRCMSVPEIKQAFKAAAEKDPDPMIRAYARECLD